MNDYQKRRRALVRGGFVTPEEAIKNT